MPADSPDLPTGEDAENDEMPIVDAHRTFLVTLACAVIFVCVVVTFII